MAGSSGPADPAVTTYDEEHIVTYLRLLDADAEGADWRDVLGTKSAVQMIEVTQKLSQGMSGGPLLDEDGAVAGINHKGGPSEARDFAVHYKALTDWLRGS